VWDYSQERAVPMRLGAQMLAVSRVTQALKARGIWP
jgi:glutamate dehydrogenase/leucine dehydrogenase